jgi:hypothetical protein
MPGSGRNSVAALAVGGLLLAAMAGCLASGDQGSKVLGPGGEGALPPLGEGGASGLDYVPYPGPCAPADAVDAAVDAVAVPGTGGSNGQPRPLVPEELSATAGITALTGVWEGAVTLTLPDGPVTTVDFMALVLDNHSALFFSFAGFFAQQRFDPPPQRFGWTPPSAILEDRRTPTGFRIRYRAGDPSNLSDYEEILEGQLYEYRLLLKYSLDGLYRGTKVKAQAVGRLKKRGVAVPLSASLAGVMWWGEVNLTAPGSSGPPRNRLMLAFGSDGKLRAMTLAGSGGKLFGEATGTFPVMGHRACTIPNENLSFDCNVESSVFDPTHFQLRTHVTGLNEGGARTDYLESITGQLAPCGLRVDYSMVGEYQSAPVNAAASGVLLH